MLWVCTEKLDISSRPISHFGREGIDDSVSSRTPMEQKSREGPEGDLGKHGIGLKALGVRKKMVSTKARNPEKDS